MKTFTHGQAQEILRSGQEASGYDQKGLTDHLSRCSKCQLYSALVSELGQVVPRMYPVALLSTQEIHRKIGASQPRLRRQSMLTLILHRTRTVIWLGASLALLLILIVLSPRLLPTQLGGNPTLTPLVSVSASRTPVQNITPKPGESIQYTVAEGESIFGIAEKFGLKPETILWVNPDKLADNPHNIKPSMVLRIPSVDGLYYRWKPEDKIEAIASQYGVASVDILNWPENAAQIGPAEKPNIQPGMLLFIPEGKMPLQPVTTMPTANTPTPSAAPLSFYPTADSSVPLSSSGPWLAYRAWPAGFEDIYGTVAVANADGSGRRMWSSNVWAIIGSPASPYLAVLSQPPELQGIYIGASILEIVHFPEMSVKTIPLISNSTIETFDYSQLKSFKLLDKQGAIQVITWAASFKKPVWSPNGRYLAFTAAIDRPSADLYVYDTLTDQIRRLTDSLDMATQPEWSPDGKWIVHRGNNTFGARCYETGVWAAALDGSEVKWLNPGECFNITRWTGPETFETFTPQSGGAAADSYLGAVKRVDIAAGTSTFLYMIPGKPQALPPIVDCSTQKTIETFGSKNNSTRIDAPNGKWFVVINDELRLYTSDEKLVAIWGPLDQFIGWQPDSSAVVFTVPGGLANRRTINYFQPADRTMKTFDNILLADGVFPDQVIWSHDLASFFLVINSSQEVVHIDTRKSQFLQVDRSIGNIQDLNYAWVGAGTKEDSPLRNPCYVGQP